MKLTQMLLVCILFLLFNSCSEEPTEPTTTANPDINNYIVSLPKWDDFCPPKIDEDTQSDPRAEWECATKAVATITPCSITRTPEEIVTFDPGSDLLYVGSLLQGYGYKGGYGSIKSLPIYQRAPITITIDVTIPDPSRVVGNPSLATVTQAVNDLKIAAHNSGYKTSSSIFYKYETSYSVDQLAISLGLSAKFMKGKAKVDLDAGWTHDREKSTVAAYFVQKMFTISVPPPQRPGDFFSSDFTQELLDEQISLGNIGPNNPPVYVSNIVYGRMMLFTMTSTHSADSMGLALDARRKNINGQIDIKYQHIIDNSTFTITTIGGDAQSALDFIRSGQSGNFFEENPDITTAVALSYTLKQLKSPYMVAKVSETTDYDLVQYDDIPVETYTNEGDWKNAVQSRMSYQKWECNWTNVLLAKESKSFKGPGYGDQWGLGKKITFLSDSTGYPFDFYLENMDGAIPPNDMGDLVYNDHESSGKSFLDLISIGDIDDWVNDDFEIGVSGNAKVFAIAFSMEDNSASSSEYLEIHAKDKNNQECQIGYITNGINGFFGIVSPVPITRIWFDESSDDDDIALGDLSFGYK